MVKDKNFSTSPRKALILKEAAHLFREKGYMASTLRELAKRSGVQGGSIYHHFSSKQEILYQIMDSTMASLLFNLKEITRDEKDPVEKLKKAIRFHIEYHVKNPDETYVTDSEIRSVAKGAYDRIVRKEEIMKKYLFRLLRRELKTAVLLYMMLN